MTQLENERSASDQDFEILIPENTAELDQNEEWFDLRMGGETKKLRLHDYADIFAIPGLYEHLFYTTLECDSPKTVSGLVSDVLRKEGRDLSELRILDVGAGNGMVAEEFIDLGAEEAIGVDIIEEAAMAAKRDRPHVYSDYLVTDLTAMTDEEKDFLKSRKLNCLTSVAALGFDDIPPEAFAEALNVIEPDGIISFCLKETMVSGDDSGFSKLIDRGLVEGALELKGEQRYRHRLAASGKPLYYVAMVAEKKGDIPV